MVLPDGFDTVDELYPVDYFGNWLGPSIRRQFFSAAWASLKIIAKRRIAIKLRTIRKSRKLTQEQLASLIDRSVDAISNIEREKALPSLEMLQVACSPRRSVRSRDPTQ